MIFSPFKTPKLRFYIGRIRHGTPYFYPRKSVKSKTKPGYLEFKPIKWFGIQIIRLGYKTKWTEWDFRFEWNPMISIVFCHMQICVWVVPKHYSYYWECYLAYKKAKRIYPNMSNTNLIKIARKKLPQIWKSKNETVDYWKLILKKKYLKPAK